MQFYIMEYIITTCSFAVISIMAAYFHFTIKKRERKHRCDMALIDKLKDMPTERIIEIGDVIKQINKLTYEQRKTS